MSNRGLEWRNIWADNSDFTNLDRGIIGFARTCFPDIAYDSTPTIHEEMYRDLLQLYNPRYRFAQERQLQEIVFRGAAKSTVSSFIFPTYISCMNGFKIRIADWDRERNAYLSMDGIEVEIREDLIVIISETGTLSEGWVTQIRGAMANNKMIRGVFGNLKSESVKDDEGKWTRSAFTIIKDNLKEEWQRGKGLTLQSKGVNMQIRGINVKGRPTLIIFDDLYSGGNTKTPESRAKIRYIANAEAKNSLDPVRGKIVSIGTVVHEDTIINDYKNSEFWHTIEYPIMDKLLFDEVITNHCRINRETAKMSYPSRQECKELESQGYITHWRERWTLEMLLAKYAEAIETRTDSTFWQEYFHITLAEEDKRIRQDMVRYADMKLVEKQINGNWYSFVSLTMPDGSTEYRHVNLGIGVDAAISYKITADNSALILVGIDYYGRLYAIKNESGKFGISDEYKTEYKDDYQNRLCLDITKIARIGSVDQMFRWLFKTRHRVKFIIEVNSIGAEVVRQARTKMGNYGMRYSLIEVLQTVNKEERIMDTLQPYYQDHAVYHQKDQQKLIYELEFLGKAKNDDNADIFATVVSQIYKPNQLVEWDKKIIEQNEGYKSPWFIKTHSTSHRNWRTT